MKSVSSDHTLTATVDEGAANIVRGGGSLHN
jgi:hypothetical protein